MSSAINPPNDQNETPRDRRRVSDDASAAPVAGRHEVVSRQREQFGGMKFGSAFFGWLAATGMAVLLTAVIAGVGTATGLDRSVNPTTPGVGGLPLAGVVGAIVLLVIVLVAYFCGGYVAGRMARFDGVRQGVAVWLWAIIVAVLVAVLGLVAGTQSNVLGTLNGVPRIPVSRATLTTAGVITALAFAVVSLIGAILGGLAGMRYHRRVDIAGFGH